MDVFHASPGEIFRALDARAIASALSISVRVSPRQAEADLAAQAMNTASSSGGGAPLP
jgi:hypothetical protein